MRTQVRTESRSMIWFKQVADLRELQMAPPFHRNPVWTTKQKSLLIDSILRGYPIPEIYVQEVIGPDGRRTPMVVDGRQRILACLEFMEGEFEIEPEHNPDFANLSFRDLLDEEKRRIYDYEFVVRLLPDVPEVVIRDILQRINRNDLALNAQELRQATYWGAFIQSMNRLSDKAYWSDLGLFAPGEIRRMLDIEFISEIAIGALHGPQNKGDSLNSWYAVYEKEFEDSSYIEVVFDKVLGELIQLVPDLHRTRWRKKSDFYTLFLVLAAHEKSLPLSSDHRLVVTEKLSTFQEQVTDYIRETAPNAIGEVEEESEGGEEGVRPGELLLGTAEAKYPREVIHYAAALRRDASEMANRLIRIGQLESLLAGDWNDGKVALRSSANTGDAGGRRRRRTASGAK
jgi:hypothetical protein